MRATFQTAPRGAALSVVLGLGLGLSLGLSAHAVERAPLQQPIAAPVQIAELDATGRAGAGAAPSRPVITGINFGVFQGDQEMLKGARKQLDLVVAGLDPHPFETNYETLLCWGVAHLPEADAQLHIEATPEAFARHAGSGEPWNAKGNPAISASWRATNEIEERRAKEAVLALLEQRVLPRATRLPFEGIAVIRHQLGPYDPAQGAFPLLTRGWPVLKDAPAYCARSFAFAPPAASFPEVWRMPESQALDILARITKVPPQLQVKTPHAAREVFIAMGLRFQAMPMAMRAEAPAAPADGSVAVAKDNSMIKDWRVGGMSSPVPVWSEVTSLDIYEDPKLERHIESLAFERGRAPVLLTGVPPEFPRPEQLEIDTATLALFLLRDHGDVLGAKAWGKLMRQHAEHDQFYFERTRLEFDGGLWQRPKGPTFDAAHIPFFYNGAGKGHPHYSAAQIALFKEWTMRRARHLPETLVLHGTLERNGNATRFSFKKASLKSAAALAKGIDANRLMRPSVYNLDGGPDIPDHDAIGSEGAARTPALLLPQPLEDYLPAITDSESAAMFANMGRRVAELALTPGGVELLPLDGGGEAVVLSVTPRRLVIKSQDRTTNHYERDFAKDPPRAAAPPPEATKVAATPPPAKDAAEAALPPPPESTQKSAEPALPPLPKKPFGPELAGVRLGMSLKEADKALRRHMTVGQVFVQDRARDTSAISGSFEKFSSSRLYVSKDGKEMVVLYDEPPSAPGMVMAVTRQVTIEPGSLSPAQALGQIRKEYGTEDWTGERGDLGWGEGLRGDRQTRSMLHPCVPSVTGRSGEKWIAEKATEVPPPHSVPMMQLYDKPVGRTCGPVFAADLRTDRGRIVLQLVDASLYFPHYDESRRLVRSGQAALGDADGGVDILAGSKAAGAPTGSPDTNEGSTAPGSGDAHSSGTGGSGGGSSSDGGGSVLPMLALLALAAGGAFAWFRVPAFRKAVEAQIKALSRVGGKSATP